MKGLSTKGEPLRITVVGSSGATGRHLILQALQRGHTVVAIARRPERIEIPDRSILPTGSRLLRRTGDLNDPGSAEEALRGSTIVVSGLGEFSHDPDHVLTTGVKAIIAARPERLVWLGSFGTGLSAAVATSFTRGLLRVALGRQMEDKVAADTLVLAAGGTVVHAGPLSNQPGSPSARAVPLHQVPRRLSPISRASVATIMLDAAESDTRGLLVSLNS